MAESFYRSKPSVVPSARGAIPQGLITAPPPTCSLESTAGWLGIGRALSSLTLFYPLYLVLSLDLPVGAVSQEALRSSPPVRENRPCWEQLWAHPDVGRPDPWMQGPLQQHQLTPGQVPTMYLILPGPSEEPYSLHFRIKRKSP